MCLIKIYNKIIVGRHLSDTFPMQNGQKERDAFITTAFQLHFIIHYQEGPIKSGGTQIKWNTSTSAVCRDFN